MQINRNHYLSKLIAKKHNGLIKVITGIRRCGKSYLLFELFRNHLKEDHILDDHIIEMSFDLYENIKFRDPKTFYPFITDQIKDHNMYYILLDEVQLLNEFEAILNSLAHRKNVDLYVTGSNAKFLSKDLITEFRGRSDQVHLYPLTFREFMSVYAEDQTKGFREYMLYGGIPLVLSYKEFDAKFEFLQNLFSETYISDLVGRHNIKFRSEFEELLNILSSSIGSLTNPNKLSLTFKSKKGESISKNTIKKYLDYCEDSFLIKSAYRYDIKGKNYIDTPLKYYFTDLGLRNVRLNFRQIEETHAMENIIFNELNARGLSVDVGVVISNEVDRNGKKIRKYREIDFICNKGSKRYYIQSALSIDDPSKKAQEEKSLLLTKDGFKKIIITRDALAPLYNEEGILIMNIYDFLLNEHSLDL